MKKNNMGDIEFDKLNLREQTRKELTTITDNVFPEINHEWLNLWDWSDDYALFNYFYDPLESYINNNYELGLLLILKYIYIYHDNEYTINVAEKLLISLANEFVTRVCDTKEKKSYVVYKLYRTYPVFREATEKYAQLAVNLISTIFVHSFFLIDKEVLSDVYSKCYTQFEENSENEKYLLNETSDKLRYNHDFSKFITLDNIDDYWELSEYINQIFPKLNFYDTLDGQKLEYIKAEVDKVNTLFPLKKKLENKDYWIDTSDLPDVIEFDYHYPNGSNGDMVRYILEQFGETVQKNSLEWTGKLSKDYLDMLEIFAAPSKFITSDIRFLSLYNFHIPTLLRSKINETHSLFVNKLSIKKDVYNILQAHALEQKKKRTELHSKLILEGRTTPKWKSEAQLYSICVSLYPDAIYQYRTEWLGLQSLDIFIPSISVGIEYQGVQHYRAIEYFGGEKHLKQQQDNDKKKAKLCKNNGIHLIAWPYTEEINEDNLKKYLNEIR